MVVVVLEIPFFFLFCFNAKLKLTRVLSLRLREVLLCFTEIFVLAINGLMLF